MYLDELMDSDTAKECTLYRFDKNQRFMVNDGLIDFDEEGKPTRFVSYDGRARRRNLSLVAGVVRCGGSGIPELWLYKRDDQKAYELMKKYLERSIKRYESFSRKNGQDDPWKRERNLRIVRKKKKYLAELERFMEEQTCIPLF